MSYYLPKVNDLTSPGPSYLLWKSGVIKLGGEKGCQVLHLLVMRRLFNLQEPHMVLSLSSPSVDVYGLRGLTALSRGGVSLILCPSALSQESWPESSSAPYQPGGSGKVTYFF